MVVCLVFKQQKPGLLHPVHTNPDLHGAGVDLFRLVELRKPAVALERLDRNGGKIHQTHRLCPAKRPAQRQIVLVGLLDLGILEARLVDHGQEGGVAAVIGPVGVDHADLGDGGVAAFFCKIGLAEGYIRLVHGKAVGLDKRAQALLVERTEAFERLDPGGDLIAKAQGLGQLHRGLAGFHRVDDVFFDPLHVLIGQIAVERIDLGRSDQGTLRLRHDLDTLGRRVRPLVKLTGQIFHSEHRVRICKRRLGAGGVDLRLGKDGFDRLCKHLGLDLLGVIPVEDPHRLQARNAQKCSQLLAKRLGLMRKRRLFFNKYSINHYASLAMRARFPMSRR